MNTIWWENDKVLMINQRKLPLIKEFITCESHFDIANAISTMIIRGAPAIGIAAAMGVALGIKYYIDNNINQDISEYFNSILDTIKNTRPTAINLFWALNRMNDIFQSNKDKSKKDNCAVLAQ